MAPSPRLLVIAAHPDDETLGCGGTIARTVREGGTADVVICTRIGPFLSRYPADSVPTLDATRHDEARRACEILGARSVTFGDFEEVHLAARPLPTLVDFLRSRVAEIHPTRVLTHHWADLHQDHRVVSEASQIALRPYADRRSVEVVLGYAVDPSHWSTPPRPTYFSPLAAEDLEKKLLALRAYETERRAPPHPRSCRSVEATAMAIGTACGEMWAEVFELIWASV